MNTFEHLKVGDKVTRMWVYNLDPLEYAGEVVEVTKTTVKCLVFVDVPRMMEFDIKTGVDTLGVEYGWLRHEE